MRRSCGRNFPDSKEARRVARRARRMSQTLLREKRRISAGAVARRSARGAESDRRRRRAASQAFPRTGRSAGSGRVRAAAGPRVRARVSAQLREASGRRSPAAAAHASSTRCRSPRAVDESAPSPEAVMPTGRRRSRWPLYAGIAAAVIVGALAVYEFGFNDPPPR